MATQPEELRKYATYCEMEASATDDQNIKASMYYLAGLWRELADKKEREKRLH
jgi:hypothetical protein